MKKSFLFLSAVSFFVLVSCGGGKDSTKKTGGDEKEKDAPAAPAESCTYTYDPSSTNVKWIAYKFTGKTPVEGKFDTVNVTGVNPGPSAIDALKGATFEIPVASLQTGDQEKNANIISDFFGKLTATVTLTGTLREISETSAVLSVKMNNIEKDITLDCKWDGEKFSASGKFSLDDYNGQEAIAALNKKCKKNHTGEDGVTKVWPEVTVAVETTLKKECAE